MGSKYVRRWIVVHNKISRFTIAFPVMGCHLTVGAVHSVQAQAQIFSNHICSFPPDPSWSACDARGTGMFVFRESLKRSIYLS